MSLSSRYYGSPRMDAADFAALRDRLISTGRWRGGMFIASVVLQAVASAAALAQPDLLVRIASPLLTAAFSLAWFFLWYMNSLHYRALRATLINADITLTTEREPKLFWVDGSRLMLVMALYVQACCVSAFIAWRMPSDNALAILSSMGPVLAWPTAIIIACVLLRDLARPAPKLEVSVDAVQDRVRTLEVRADNARLPEPEPSPGSSKESDEFRLLVENAPRAAVILAWREVEQEVHRFAQEMGLTHEGAPFHRLTQMVLSNASVPAEVRELIDELRKIRNEALHTDRDFTSYAAEEYLRLSRRVIAWLRKSMRSNKESSEGDGLASGQARQFTVVLQGLSDFSKKVSVIKVLRELMGCGLAEGKTLVESTPSPLRTDLSEREAAAWKERIEEAGGRAQVVATASVPAA